MLMLRRDIERAIHYEVNMMLGERFAAVRIVTRWLRVDEADDRVI